MEVNGQIHAPSRFTHGERAPLHIGEKIVWLQSRSERGSEEKKIPPLSLPGIKLRSSSQ
jgi:hypothetical protein